MNDRQLPPIADERLLAAINAVNPPVEKLGTSIYPNRLKPSDRNP